MSRNYYNQGNILIQSGSGISMYNCSFTDSQNGFTIINGGTVQGNGLLLQCDGCVITGNDCLVIGKKNAVVGNKNLLFDTELYSNMPQENKDKYMDEFLNSVDDQRKPSVISQLKQNNYKTLKMIQEDEKQIENFRLLNYEQALEYISKCTDNTLKWNLVQQRPLFAIKDWNLFITNTNDVEELSKCVMKENWFPEGVDQNEKRAFYILMNDIVSKVSNSNKVAVLGHFINIKKTMGWINDDKPIIATTVLDSKDNFQDTDSTVYIQKILRNTSDSYKSYVFSDLKKLNTYQISFFVLLEKILSQTCDSYKIYVIKCLQEFSVFQTNPIPKALFKLLIDVSMITSDSYKSTVLPCIVSNYYNKVGFENGDYIVKILLHTSDSYKKNVLIALSSVSKSAVEMMHDLIISTSDSYKADMIRRLE